MSVLNVLKHLIYRIGEGSFIYIQTCAKINMCTQTGPLESDSCTHILRMERVTSVLTFGMRSGNSLVSSTTRPAAVEQKMIARKLFILTVPAAAAARRKLDGVTVTLRR